MSTSGGEAEAGAVLRLEVVRGNAIGFGIAVEDRLVIGRQLEGPGCLADDLELSRHHAEISREPSGDYVIADLSSKNGTFVNGERLEAPVVLARGDRIEVGSTALEVLEVPTTIDARATTLAGEAPAMRIAPLELHLTVDVLRAEAAIALSAEGEPIKLRLTDGGWQFDGGES